MRSASSWLMSTISTYSISRGHLAGHLLVVDGDGFIPQLQQAWLLGHPQQPVVLFEVADGFAQPLAEGAVLVHVDGVADELVDVPVVAGPELDALLAPGGDDVQTPCTGHGSAPRHGTDRRALGRFLNVEQSACRRWPAASRVSCKLAQGLAGLMQELSQLWMASDPVLGQQGRDPLLTWFCCSSMARWVRSMRPSVSSRRR